MAASSFLLPAGTMALSGGRALEWGLWAAFPSYMVAARANWLPELRW